MRCILLLLACVTIGSIVSVAFTGALWAKPLAGDVAMLKKTKSLADRIRGHHTVHIVYVHGMRENGTGASDRIVALLVSKLGFGKPAGEDVHRLALNEPANATFAGQKIWRSPAEWAASQPFVRRRTLVRADDQARVIVDEVNWWPLLFPLKCRFILIPDHDLAGKDPSQIDLCANVAKDPNHHDWVTGASGADELARPPRGGHAAKINSMLKRDIMNWGMADAVIALGPMQTQLHEAMEQAFAFAAKDVASDDSFVVMSESLGSFVVLDAMAWGKNAVQDVLERTDDLYFFANQFALLELGRLQFNDGASYGISPDSAVRPPASPIEMLRRWPKMRNDAIARSLAAAGSETPARDHVVQIIAFSDPSDILTYRVPKLDGVTVVNLYDRNATRWLGLYESPKKAHLGHLDNSVVWKVLMGRY